MKTMEKKLFYITPLTEFSQVMYEGMIAATVPQDDWAEGKGISFEDEDSEGEDLAGKNLWDE